MLHKFEPVTPDHDFIVVVACQFCFGSEEKKVEEEEEEEDPSTVAMCCQLKLHVTLAVLLTLHVLQAIIYVHIDKPINPLYS